MTYKQDLTVMPCLSRHFREVLTLKIKTKVGINMKPLFNPYHGKALSFYRMVTRDRTISRGVRYFSHYLDDNCKKPLVFEVNQRGYLHIYRIEELATNKDCGLIRLYDLLLREKGDLYLKDSRVITGTISDYVNSLEQLEKR